MRRMLVALTTTLLLAGCSGDPTAESPPSDASSSPTAEPLTTADVNAAIRAFRKAGSGAYYVRGTLVAEAPALTHTGRYDLADGYVDELATPEGVARPSSKVRTIAIERDSWIAVETPDADTCWMHFGPTDSEVFGVDLGAGSLGLPPVAYVVSTLAAEEDGTVTSDLYSVLLMFSGKTPRALGIAPDATDRVEVSLDLEDGAIADVSVSPDQLVTAVEDAGLDLGPLGDVRDDLAVTVALHGYGESVDVVRPPRTFTVEVTEEQAAFEADRRACDQRLADSS